MAVTIKDVAKLANVSISTVSRVINGSKPVSPEIAQRVNEVISETGYIPNPVARSLVMKKSRLIGAIVPDIATFYIGEILNAMEEIAKTYEYDILLFNSYGDVEREVEMIEKMVSKQVEGIVLMSHFPDERHYKILQDHRMPSVIINRKTENEDTLSVVIDHRAATKKAIEHLLDLGHQDIALIRCDDSEETFGNDQFLGYKEALEEKGIRYNPELVLAGDFKAETAYKEVTQLLENGQVPTGIVATTDDMAIGVINAIIDCGYKVPEDISVVAFQNTRIASLFRPKLTTIAQPVYDMGAIALRLLIKKIQGTDTPKEAVVVDYDFIQRNSSQRREE
jgi:LacI family transcriptional regulator